MSAIDDLRGVVRIAKAASIGVTGNGPRIERAERAIDAMIAMANSQTEMESAIARFAVEKAEFRRLSVALAECVEIVHDAEKDWRREGHMGMPDSVYARLADVLERARELGVLATSKAAGEQRP